VYLPRELKFFILRNKVRAHDNTPPNRQQTHKLPNRTHLPRKQRPKPNRTGHNSRRHRIHSLHNTPILPLQTNKQHHLANRRTTIHAGNENNKDTGTTTARSRTKRMAQHMARIHMVVPMVQTTLCVRC